MNSTEKNAVKTISHIFESYKTAPYLLKSYGSKAQSLEGLVSFQYDVNLPPRPESIPMSEFIQWSHDYEKLLELKGKQLGALEAIMPDSITENNLGREQVHSYMETIISNPEGFDGIGLHLLINMQQAAGIIRRIESAGYKGSYRSPYWGIQPKEVKVKVIRENPEAVALFEETVLFYASQNSNIATT